MFRDDLVEMFEVIRHACASACAAGTQATVFDLWEAMHGAQETWATERGHPALLWGRYPRF